MPILVMKIALIVLLVAIAFSLGIRIGIKIHKRSVRAMQKYRRTLQSICEMGALHTILEDLRRQPAEHAIELCECLLDYSVSRVWHSLEPHQDIEETSRGCLKRVKDYRRQWPRQVVANEWIAFSDAKEVAEKATKILNGM